MKIFEAKIKYKHVGECTDNAIDLPGLAVEYMKDAFDEYQEQEQFWVIALNRKNRPLGRLMVTLGTATSSLVHPREVYRFAIIKSASAIICLHNHPSGDPSPSSADIRVTRQLREASETVGIHLLDHVIVGEKEHTEDGTGFYSFNDNGLL